MKDWVNTDGGREMESKGHRQRLGNDRKRANVFHQSLLHIALLGSAVLTDMTS